MMRSGRRWPIALLTTMRVSQVARLASARNLRDAERAQIGLLHHVLGLSVIPDDRPCDPVEPLIVPSNDQAQRGRTPLPRETHEFGIDQSGQLQLGGGLLRHAH